MPKIFSNLDMQSEAVLVNLPDPTDPQHAATKAYVDAVAQGLDPKESCRIGSDNNANWSGSASADFVTGTGLLTISGLTAGTSLGLLDATEPAVGDRILIKDMGTINACTTDSSAEATPAKYNGIWVVQAGGSNTSVTLERAADFDGSPAGEVSAGAHTFITEGSVWADTGWVVSSDDPHTINVTAIIWTQFSAAGTYNFRDGLTQNGVNVDVTPAASGGLEIAGGAGSGGGIQIKLDATAHGGNGSGLALASGGLSVEVDGTTTEVNSSGQIAVTSGARKLLYTANIGGSSSITVTHNLSSTDIQIEVYDNTNNDVLLVDKTIIDANNIRLDYIPALAPGANAHRVVILG